MSMRIHPRSLLCNINNSVGPRNSEKRLLNNAWKKTWRRADRRGEKFAVRSYNLSRVHFLFYMWL